MLTKDTYYNLPANERMAALDKDIKMLEANLTDDQVKTAKVIAFAIKDLNNSVTYEEALHHTLANGLDENKFFGTNGVGRQEYQDFVLTNDADKHKRTMQRKRLKQKQKRSV